MGHLLRVSRKRKEHANASEFPFDVPAIRTLDTLELGSDITFFVGENGSGKSTLLEGIACAAELPTVGFHEVAFDDTLAAQRSLANELRLAWSRRSRQGFYLRAEDFFGYLRRTARDDARIAREKLEVAGISVPEDVNGLGARHLDEQVAAQIVGRYDARSHGESFLDLFRTRVRPSGLYLLDEPEAPLSPTRQIAFARLLLERARAGAQFVIATHSPILLACPGATILSFDTIPVSGVAYDTLEHVTVTRTFLEDPAKHLA